MGQYFDNEKLPSKMVKTSAVILGKKFTFFTDNGVFSKDGLDFGSRLLLESIPLEAVGGKILDMGCGYGVFGIVIGKLAKAHVDMVDVNLRALHLCEINIKENHCNNINVFESNVYENVSGKYSTIVTNPPIRAGKKVVYDIVMNARNYLLEEGRLFLVIRKEQGAKSLIVDLKEYYNVEILEKKKGFYILKCSILKNN
jgi:16S rRNA (guanine1207-N2)-methyltransferase